MAHAEFNLDCENDGNGLASQRTGLVGPLLDGFESRLSRSKTLVDLYTLENPAASQIN